MKGLVILVLTAICALAQARPLLIAPTHLQIPLPATPEYPSQYQTLFAHIAIDGDFVLVAANRATNTSGGRTDGVYIFQRAADGAWNYGGALVEGQQGMPVLGGNVATVTTYPTGFDVYERSAGGWSRTAMLRTGDVPIRIEN